MHQAVTRRLQAGVLDGTATAEVQASLAAHRRAFAQGIDVPGHRRARAST
jgi:hypothetical protein